MGCTNQTSQFVPRGYDYVEVRMECGRTGMGGHPVYCSECIEAEAKRGHAKHQCIHGVDLYPEDGRDIPCGQCEGGY